VVIISEVVLVVGETEVEEEAEDAVAVAEEAVAHEI
jgi:hypothetical protein